MVQISYISRGKAIIYSFKSTNTKMQLKLTCGCTLIHMRF